MNKQDKEKLFDLLWGYVLLANELVVPDEERATRVGLAGGVCESLLAMGVPKAEIDAQIEAAQAVALERLNQNPLWQLSQKLDNRQEGGGLDLGQVLEALDSVDVAEWLDEV